MRRLISLVSVSVALAGLAFVLVNATTVDRRPPTVKAITLSAPAGDDRLAQTLTAIDIEFSEPVRTATAEARFRIAPVVDGAFTWSGSTAIFTPSRKLPSNTTFTIWIDPGVQDLEGNADPTGLEAWRFRTVGPPVVLRTIPTDGATGAPLSGSIELVFDRLMDTASVEAAIRMDPPASTKAIWRGSLLTIEFETELRPSTTYSLSVGADAADTGGSTLGVPFTTRFVTAGSGLEIVAVVPAAGVAGIGIDTPIAILFNAPIAGETAGTALQITPNVDGAVRTLRLEGATIDTQTGSPTAPPDTLVFVPSQPLAPHTTYTLTLDSTVARLDDPSAIASGRRWTFTTGAPTVSGQNQIAFLGARGGVRNVWVMNPDGTNQRQLTVELLPVSSFDATARGGMLAFAAGGVVSVMDIDGSGLRRLTQDDGRAEYAPVFGPDQAHLIVARRDAAGADQGFWLVPLPGTPGDERQLLDHGAPEPGSAALAGDGVLGEKALPVWMPRIAFDPSGRVALLVLSSGEVTLIELTEPDDPPGPGPRTVALTAHAPPIWVPARDAFVVTGQPREGGTPALFAVDLRGRISRIANTGGAVGPVALAPNGSLAVGMEGLPGGPAIRVINLDGGVQDLASTVGIRELWPAFSPDGLSLLVGRTLVAQPSESIGIWRVNAVSGVSRQLTTDGAYASWIR